MDAQESGSESGVANDVAASPDGKVLATASDGDITLWDLATGRPLRTLEGHAGGVYAVAMSGDGTRALSGSADKTLRVWDLATGRLLRTLKGHAGGVYAVAMGGDGTWAGCCTAGCCGGIE